MTAKSIVAIVACFAGVRERLPVAGVCGVAVVAWGVFATVAPPVHADPCGMVPPIIVASAPIERMGLQKTYVFYRNGIETFVIRPGYRGQVDNFGMLIPFPTPPAIRKVPDAIFPHITAAVDPPEVLVDLRVKAVTELALGANVRAAGGESDLRFDAIRVLRQEAVGMYEVTVLEAGSAAALKKWMDGHGYRYPDGMDAVCEEYVEDGWCFVAVKTRVGNKAGVNPRPGLRHVDSALPESASFDGHVQAMGFRFKTDEFVVPMRLSAFNEGELRNVVYILTDEPKRIHNIPRAYVVRQIDGETLYRHLTGPLPLRILGGDIDDISRRWLTNLSAQRNPEAHNGLALELFASDLSAARTQKLFHEFEEFEKELLRIGERLGLRGVALDNYHSAALASARKTALRGTLEDIKTMTLTVVDGEFSREVIAGENLTFKNFAMAKDKNSAKHYDAREFGPKPDTEGALYETGSLDPRQVPGLFLAVSGVLLIGLVLVGRRQTHAAWMGPKDKTFMCLVAAATAGAVVFASVSLAANDASRSSGVTNARVARWIDDLADPREVDVAVESLVALGNDAIDPLLDVARNGSELGRRGWAIVCLGEIGGDATDRALEAIHNDRNELPLVRTWAAAARVQRAEDGKAIETLAHLVAELPPLGRPLGKKFISLRASHGRVSIEALIDASVQAPQMQAALSGPIFSAGAESLVAIMLTSSNGAVRRQATAYVAGLAAQGNDGVMGRVIDALRYVPGADSVPWSGGALFVPAMSWPQDEARELAGNLVKWLVFCVRNDLADEARQIGNNLRSMGLLRAAGYLHPRQSGSTGWLRAWGRAFGRESLVVILEEQHVTGEDRFRELLEDL